ncbi:hypothetical protein [uncultured Hymenobacter sp.]|uniref:hypothetical protein n=1 Tax=uncultured Hymenobacter sp. TaxID=170016 RepID=UPI0035CB33CC
MTENEFVGKWRLRFADNDTFTIDEGDLRELTEDIVTVFGSDDPRAAFVEILENQVGKHPAFKTSQNEVNLFLLQKLTAQLAVAAPDAPTFSGFNDGANTVAISHPEYALTDLRYDFNGQVGLAVPADGIIRVGNLAGQVTGYVRAAGGRAQGVKAFTPAFTTTAVTVTITPSAPSFSNFDDAANTLNVFHPQYGMDQLRYDFNGQTGLLVSATGLLELGNQAGQVTAYVVADASKNRGEGEKAYSRPFTVGSSVVTPPVGTALTVAFTIGSSTSTPGQNVSFTGSASGGTAPYTHEVQATNTATGTVIGIGSFVGAQYAGSWQNVPAGSYELTDTVTDAAGTKKISVVRSLTVSAASATPLLAPTNPQATATSSSVINVTCSSVLNATGYALEVALTANGIYEEIYRGVSASYNHTGLPASSPRHYRWKALGTGSYSDSAYSTVATATTQAVTVKDIHLVFAGNSIVNDYDGDFTGSVVAGFRAYLLSLGDTRQITFTKVAVGGQTTRMMRANSAAVIAAYKPGWDNVLLTWELFNEYRASQYAGEGLDPGVTDPAAITAKIDEGIATIQGYFQDRLDEHSDWRFAVGSTPPDKYTGNVAPFAPPRANFYQLIQLPVSNRLRALLANGTAKFQVLADVARDLIYDPSDPAQAEDGVHPSDYGLEKGFITSRWVATLVELFFGVAQPAPVVASGAGTIPAGAGRIALGADNASIANNGSNGYYTTTGGGPGSYGVTTYTGKKLVGAGCWGHVTRAANALDVVLLFSAAPQPTGVGASVAATWNSSQSGDGLDTVDRLTRFDSGASPGGARTTRPTTLGDTQAIWRVVNPDGDGLDRLVLRSSTNYGVSWTDIYTYEYRIATGQPLYLGADFSGPGACYDPFAIGAVNA